MKRILQHTFALLTARERKLFWILSAMDVLVSVLDILSLAILLWIVNIYTHPAGIVSAVSWLNGFNSLTAVAFFLLFFCIKNISAWLLQKQQYRFVYKVAARLSERNLLRYLESGYQQYAGMDSSVHIRRIGQHPVEFGQYVLAGFQQIITQSVLIVFALAAILWFKASLFVLLFLVLTPPVIGVAFLIRRRTKLARTQTKANSEKALQYLKEGLSGYIESNIYEKHDFFVKRYATWQERLNGHLAALQGIQGLSGRLLEVIAVLGLFVLIVISRWSGNQSFDILVIGAFMGAAYKIIPGIVKLLSHSGQIRAYSFTVNDLAENELFLKKKETGPGKKKLNSLAFSHVSYSYNRQPLLQDTSFSVKAGEFVGISGVSGSGKTTMLNLLLGFINPDEGIISINDKATDIAGREKYRHCIAYVKQQPFLIHDTIQANITLDDDNCDLEKLEFVLQATGLKPLLEQYPEGLQKLVTENGKNISGGQRQRIVIARALYKDAGLVILDEPFNELDRESEKIMLLYFRQMASEGKMVILITHNKESFSYCDKIISLYEK